jgi:hypothetical protein
MFLRRTSKETVLCRKAGRISAYGGKENITVICHIVGVHAGRNQLKKLKSRYTMLVVVKTPPVRIAAPVIPEELEFLRKTYRGVSVSCDDDEVVEIDKTE